MKKQTFLNLFLAATMATIPATMLAVPAMPGLRSVVQSDGTTLNVRLIGDEFSHMYVTEDNYPLAFENGVFNYATVNADGIVVNSGIRATAPGRRSLKERAFLNAIDRDLQFSLLADRGMERRTAMQHRTAAVSERATGVGIPSGASMLTQDFPHMGEHRSLVVLVEYKDVKFNVSDPKGFYERMCNQRGFSEYDFSGCLAEYFETSSNGNYKPVYDVYGPVALDYNRDYYGANKENGDDVRPWMMATHAVAKLDPEVDFSIYDANGDGEIDNVVVIYAGVGEATNNVPDAVWPHMYWAHGTEKFDGVTVNTYVCINEWLELSAKQQPAGIGIFAHEFSHALGLPDVYDPYYTHFNTPGEYTLMDTGCHLNNSYTPVLHSAYEAYCLGWNEYEILSGNRDLVLEPHGKCYIIETDKRNEFFVIEARDKTGWDSYLSNNGMLVWHIDYSKVQWSANSVNTNAYHQRIDLVEADNKEGDGSRRNDPFPGRSSQFTELSATTSPALVSWSGFDMGISLTDIRRGDNGTVLLTVKDANDTALDAIEAPVENNAPIEYFDLQGRRLAYPAQGTLVIRRQGNDVSKFIVR